MEKNMKLKVYLLCAYLLLFCSSALAQQKPADPLGESLFSPELLMQHQNALSLSDDQRNFIKTEMRKAHLQYTELNFQLQDEMEIMISLVKQEKMDESQVLSQLDKLLGLEREIKRIHFTLIVRLKNSLTSEQQGRLQELKNKNQHK
jgi:Spy/CpxP family protein refolding chaperone